MTKKNLESFVTTIDTKPRDGLVLGIDPGTLKTGWAILDPADSSVVLYGHIQANTNIKVHKRSLDIVLAMKYVLRDILDCGHVIEHGLIEDQFTAINSQSAIVLARLTGELTYCIYSELGIIPTILNNSAAKAAIGISPRSFSGKSAGASNKAMKDAVVAKVKEMYGLRNVQVDEAFAIAIATWKLKELRHEEGTQESGRPCQVVQVPITEGIGKE